MPTDTLVYRSFEPDLEVKKDGVGRTVRGIAVPFNRPQPIDANLTEGFRAEAFNHQLRALFRTGFWRDHSVSGGVLLGPMREGKPDTAGLYGEWRVSKTAAGDEALELIKDEALRELSIGFRFRPGDSTRDSNGVTWRERADLTETAIVPWGAYGDGAIITDVRAALSADANGAGVVPPQWPAGAKPCPTCDGAGHIIPAHAAAPGHQAAARAAGVVTAEINSLAEARALLAGLGDLPTA